ncbi:formate C-acetyltransferase [Clostridium saccharobutylicum]|uniref:Formate acetyltransferase n=1 Tax=Clostridium saccharobutylicum DSM 13864 TaxID=1345695 RepID=U5MRF6_CLOSA|nr:formate C-acetyltransferase [Clostridium saccharobutylicum]AGX42256.1 formate acetyltransferase Pfl [Clostridium saccharobutylicum DSM 13864]AQR89537.1 formate acetyltransferase [Clostridium saccharobutylicum]AQR99439.1 formate acetyltransferase [Clostridium saccharobutylicum]AQS09170.1 formate acetyltransferase [Clostridium saccharobutylicum]AQS13425.1 formate acetyltransferase [Clostridium saccharobutylicum]
MFKQWEGFSDGTWKEGVDVRNFIQKNYKLYEGDSSFLESTTEKTDRVWEKAYALIVEEVRKGIIDVATDRVSGIDNYEAGYIDKDNEVIVGLQTDAPLKRIVNPFGGMRMVKSSLEEYGYKLDGDIEKHFSQYRKTHNEGVFDAYTKEIRAARSAGLLTGLPDAYGRGRIIGDYRRVALYGIDYLIEEKKKDLDSLHGDMLDELVRKREEVSEQIRALGAVKSMASRYGIDISKPAGNAKEAVQALYFGYLAGIKENNGAATSFGRTSTFLDIYIERDLEAGLITEKEAQELVDQLIIKLRLVRHLRTPEYNELFGGDPTWVTESIGGMGINGKPLVTKNSYRYLHTLINLGTSAEPNLTVLWSDRLPENFKKYCAEISIKTDAIQYESDEVMRPIYGDDYAIACCVSAMKVGKQMQFFGARANVAKSLLYAINGGVDELKGIKVVPGIEKLTDEEILDFNKVKSNYNKVLEYVAKIYVDTMNIIHCMHDKYAYEASQMALHDTAVERLMAFGIAGLSVAIDSLSAIKYAKVKPIRNEEGIAVDFEVEGEFPKYGNDDDRADDLGVELVTKFSNELKKHPLYRDAKHTLSALTITSNVMYGKKTGTTPDGRKKGEPLAPGANPMHGRDKNGALASLNSVAKIPYNGICQDGVSNTFSIVPDALGKDEKQKIDNLVSILDGYFVQGAHHLNVNVLNRQTLIDAMENPDKYPTLTIRVSGYAVNFSRLSKEQQLEVISRTFHESI